LSSRQYGIDLTPFHGDIVIGDVMNREMNYSERNLLHVHRSDPRQELRKSNFAFSVAPDVDVEETEVSAVL